MPTLLLDPYVAEELRKQRAAWGGDRYDEVWDGVYRMAPLPGDEHQQLVGRLASIFQDVMDWPGRGTVRPGVNITNRKEDWRQNYRCPDVAVFLPGGSAENCGVFWYGGPDFLVEVVSEYDDTRAKIPFYAQVKVREMFIVERDPWALELLRLQDDQLALVGRSELPNANTIQSAVLPFTFRLVSDEPRQRIEVVATETQQTWLV